MKNKSCLLLIIFVLTCTGNYGLADDTSSSTAAKKIKLYDYDLGSKLNPVKCDKVNGEIEYLKRLRDMTGKPVVYNRTGHGGPILEYHYLDKYEITSADGQVSVEIYMDMYNPGYVETRTIKEFKIAPPGSVPITKKENKGIKKQKTKPTPTKKPLEKTKPKTTKPQSKKTTRQQSPEKEPAKKKTVQKKPIVTKQNIDTIPGFDDKPDDLKKQPKKTPTPKPTPTPSPEKKQANVDKIPGFDDVPTKKKVSPAQTQKYISLLPVSDQTAKKKEPANSFQVSINQAVVDALAELNQAPDIIFSIDQTGHTIKDNQAAIRKLHDIRDNKQSEKEKMEKFKNDILEPEQIDLIVTGDLHFEKKSNKYKITPLIISKSDDRFVNVKKIAYSVKMKDSQIKTNFKTKIVTTIKKNFPKILSTPAKGQKKSVFVSLIPFSDPTKKPAKKEANLTLLLDEVLQEGITSAVKKHKNFLLNERGFTIHDVETEIKKVNNTLLDSKLTKDEQVKKIVNDIMIPNNINFLVVTHYKEDTQYKIVTVQTFILSQDKKKYFPKNLIFQNENLFCLDQKSGNPVLCNTAHDNIINALQNLFDQVIK